MENPSSRRRRRRYRRDSEHSSSSSSSSVNETRPYRSPPSSSNPKSEVRRGEMMQSRNLSRGAEFSYDGMYPSVNDQQQPYHPHRGMARSDEESYVWLVSQLAQRYSQDVQNEEDYVFLPERDRLFEAPAVDAPVHFGGFVPIQHHHLNANSSSIPRREVSLAVDPTAVWNTQFLLEEVQFRCALLFVLLDLGRLLTKKFDYIEIVAPEAMYHVVEQALSCLPLVRVHRYRYAWDPLVQSNRSAIQQSSLEAVLLATHNLLREVFVHVDPILLRSPGGGANISTCTFFTGKISNEEIPRKYNSETGSLLDDFERVNSFPCDVQEDSKKTDSSSRDVANDYPPHESNDAVVCLSYTNPSDPSVPSNMFSSSANEVEIVPPSFLNHNLEESIQVSAAAVSS